MSTHKPLPEYLPDFSPKKTIAYDVSGACVIFATCPEDALDLAIQHDLVDPEDRQEVVPLRGAHELSFDFSSIGGSGIVKQRVHVWIDFYYHVKLPVVFCQTDW